MTVSALWSNRVISLPTCWGERPSKNLSRQEERARLNRSHFFKCCLALGVGRKIIRWALYQIAGHRLVHLAPLEAQRYGRSPVLHGLMDPSQDPCSVSSAMFGRKKEAFWVCLLFVVEEYGYLAPQIFIYILSQAFCDKPDSNSLWMQFHDWKVASSNPRGFLARAEELS